MQDNPRKVIVKIEREQKCRRDSRLDFHEPDGLNDEQFENQLAGFDREIALWKKALEGRQN